MRDTFRAMNPLPIENVQSYPRPPLLEPAAQTVPIVLGEIELARTTQALRVCETHHPPTYYIPNSDIRMELLYPSARRSWCEWKGRARYFDLSWKARAVRNAAWDYPRPTPGFAQLRNHLAFYASAVDEAWVGEERVQSQPGDFYGGWVTANLTGRIKGAPGTEGW